MNAEDRVEVAIEAEAWPRALEADPAETTVFVAQAVDAGVEAAGAGRTSAIVSVLLTDDARIADLNERFMGNPKPTNVLSWPAFAWARPMTAEDWETIAPPAFEDGAPGPVLGDVAVALETMLGEAATAEMPPREHAARLIVHGVLHLCGFDHISREGACAMQAAEARALARLGWSRPLVDERDGA